MVRIPGGSFWMGSPEGEGDADEHPQRRVSLSAYCIDRTEVTVAAYSRCVSSGACRPAPTTVQWSGLSDADRTLWSEACTAGRSGMDNHPINCVDWSMATEFCQSQGARLPTEAEWEYAARGGDGRRYPWGNDTPSPSLLNACGSECAAWGRARGRTFRTMFGGDDGWATTAPVGSYPGGASPFGLMDMAGNVWEWVSDWYSATYPPSETSDPRGAQSGDTRVLRGGSWSGNDVAGVRAADRGRDAPSLRYYSLGFRCARGAL